MSLVELVDNTKTDKNTVHSYLGLYQTLLEGKRESAKHVLEVGVFNGGSIKLWKDFFTNATVHGADILSIDKMWKDITNTDRIVLYNSIDAYSEDVVNSLFVSKNITFDFVLDDGPHTLDSMKQFIHLYLPLLAEDGILIIEDVQDINWIEILTNEVPNELKSCIQVFDLRKNKNRWDDIVFAITKNNLVSE